MKNIERLKSHFAFTRGEQSGILLLILFICALWFLRWGWEAQQKVPFQIDSQELLRLQHEMDSLERIALEKRKPKLFPFNPNFISDYKGYVLGLSPKELDRLSKFREEGQWIRSASQFQEVTGVSDEWMDTIAPLFKFPIRHFGRTLEPKSFNLERKENGKLDLNKATEEELMQVPGIGKVFSRRIIEFREKLGGFTGEAQLYAVYGLKESTIHSLLRYFQIATPVPIQKQNINAVSASDLSTLPGISFELGVAIWEFIRKENGIDSLDELQKIDEITPQKIALIQLYLSAGP